MSHYLRIVNLLCLWSLASFHSWSQEGSVILFDHGSYGIDFSDLTDIQWRFDRHYQVHIKEALDIDILTNISIETATQEKEKITAAKVEVKGAQGVRGRYNVDSFVTQPFDAEYTDQILTVDDLQVGDTLDIAYTVKSKVSNKTHRWVFQYAYPVRESKVTFLIPEAFDYVDHITNRTYLVQERALDSVLQVKRNKIPLKGLAITCTDIPPFQQEIFAPELVETRPTFLLALSSFDLPASYGFIPDWDTQFSDIIVSEWFGKQYRVRQHYRWLARAADELLDTKYEDKLMMLKLYQFVHSRFTWDGSYGLFPSYTVEEMEYQQEVNKASMNMALLALLNEAGFKAYPLLVTTTDMPPVVSELADVNQFNHFIVSVEQGKSTIYLDAGNPDLPVGWIDSGVRRGLAVRLKNYKGQWITLPEWGSTSAMVIDLQIKEDFSASGSIQCSFSGYDAFTERQLLREDKTGRYWKDRATLFCEDARIDSVKFEHVTNLLEPFKNQVFFHIEPSPDHAERVLNPVFYSFFSEAYFQDSQRVSDVLLPFVIEEQVVLNVTMPASLTVAPMAAPAKLSLEGGKASMEYYTSQEAEQLHVRFRIKLSTSRFPAQDYAGLQSFMNQALEKVLAPVVLQRE